MSASSISWGSGVRRVTLSEQAERLASRKRELGLTDSSRFLLARNDGRSRTPEKRRLLQIVEDEAARQGRRPWATSRY